MRTRLALPSLTALVALAATAPAQALPDPGAPTPTGASPAAALAPTSYEASAAASVDSVLVVSVDGLTPRALKRLGRKRTPNFHRLIAQGVSTRNARTVVELTTTLPNHTSMVTGRRVTATQGGHGVTWNSDEKAETRTVHEAAGEHVASVFTVVDSAGGSSALFAGKSKFSLWRRSWGNAIDRTTIRERDARLAKAVRTDLRRHDRELRFWHVATPDRAGHTYGAMSKQYLAAVRKVDRMLGATLRTLRSTPKLRGKVAVVLTSDHGVHRGKRHTNEKLLDNQRVLLVARGRGIARGMDLYALNPDRVQDPGRRQPGYAADVPPVRNADVGNLALDLLGLPAIGGSQFNAGQDLAVTQ